MATTAATAANCLDHGKQPRPALPSFMMNTIPDNHPGATANPLLIVNTRHDGNTNSFITTNLATNHQNCQDNRNTVVFKNNIPEVDKQINTRLAEIANQDPPPSETTVTSCLHHPVPDRCQFTKHREHQYQSTYTNQNRSYTNNYNRNYNHTWESHTNRTCNSCAQKDTSPNIAPKHHFGASGATPPHIIHKLADPNPDQAHLWNHQVQVVTTQPNPPTNTILQITKQYLSTPHSHLQLHQVMRNGQNC